MKQQDYSNHRQYVPGFHFLLSSLIIAICIMSVVSLAQVWDKEQWLRGGVIPVVTSFSMLLMYWYVRRFPTVVQDRAIRAEESLRHYILSGKPIDSRLTTGQVVALRFAGDDELLALTERVIKEGMTPDAIKKAIKNWRADDSRC